MSAEPNSSGTESMWPRKRTSACPPAAAERLQLGLLVSLSRDEQLVVRHPALPQTIVRPEERHHALVRSELTGVRHAHDRVRGSRAVLKQIDPDTVVNDAHFPCRQKYPLDVPACDRLGHGNDGVHNPPDPPPAEAASQAFPTTPHRGFPACVIDYDQSPGEPAPFQVQQWTRERRQKARLSHVGSIVTIFSSSAVADARVNGNGMMT